MNLRETLQALLDGKRIRKDGWLPEAILRLNEVGKLVNEENQVVGITIFHDSTFQLAYEPNPHATGTLLWAVFETRANGRWVRRASWPVRRGACSRLAFDASDSNILMVDALATDWQVVS